MARKGKPISKEHKAALLAAITGRAQSEKTKKALLEASHKRKNTATHCRNGHEYTPENTVIRKDGYRECRICNRDKKRRYNDRIKVKDKQHGLKGRPWSEARRAAHEDRKKVE